MADDFDIGQQIGELVSKVEALTQRVEAVDREMKAIHEAYARGKGILVGAMLMAGFGVGQIKDWLMDWLKG